MTNTEKVATPVSIPEFKVHGTENTCGHCCKRIYWEATYHTWRHWGSWNQKCNYAVGSKVPPKS